MSPRFSAPLLRTAGFVTVIAMVAGIAAAADTSAGAPCKAGKDDQRVRIELSVPETQSVVSMVAAVTYDPSLLQLPDTPNAALRKRVTPRQEGAMVAPHNAPGALRLVAAKAAGLTTGALADVAFDRCANAHVATATDLHCTVESCAGSGGPVPGCACAVALP